MINIYNNKNYKCNIKKDEFEIIEIMNDRYKKMIKLQFSYNKEYKMIGNVKK